MKSWAPDARIAVGFSLIAATIAIASAIHICGLRPSLVASGALAMAALFTALWAASEQWTARTRDSDDLRRSRAELEGASQHAEGMNEGLAQELRSQVRAVDGFAQILENAHGTELGEEGSRTLARLRAAALRSTSLVDGLLRYSDVGRHRMASERVDMDALAREVVAGLLVKFPNARVRVGTLPAVHGDSHLLRQVWTELVSNALKFSKPAPAPEVEIEASSLSEEVEYRVRDNGAGFDLAQRHRLFAPFQRLHRAEEFAGGGMGLAVVRLAVAKHGGRVRAEGRPGQGATFAFALPRAPSGEINSH